MKILQIRGRNLASLAGDFDLDFEHGPLADAGLFAIAGPTGAGKSTLLDALCLALYDRTPRLESNSGYQIPDGPDESLGVHDTRNLLRRGTADGLAEVRFVGTDGRCYRASWSVRRARLKVGGKLQLSELQLLDDVSGQPLGRTKTEVLAATERAVGLTFDQFRRSVLLAQGDFAAFLRARSDERAELLERMTGTELYSAVSRRAYVKAREIEQALRLQEEAAKALPVLDVEARAALQAQVAELDQTVTRTAERLAVLRQQKAWWTRAAELRHKLDQARDRLAAAGMQWTEAAPRRQALADIERAQPLRAVDREAARTADEHAAAGKALEAAEGDWAQARQADERAASRLAQAAEDLERRRSEAESTKPQIDGAKRLDQSIAEKTQAVEATDRKLAQARLRLAELEREGRTLAERRASVSSTLERLTDWLDANAAAVALAQGWSEGVAPQLQAFEKAHARWSEQLAALPVLQQVHQQAVTGQTQAQRVLEEAEAAATAAQECVRSAEAAEAQQPAGDLAERRTALESLRLQVTRLQQQRELAAKADAECRRLDAESVKTRAEAVDAETHAGQAAAARQEVERQRAATERLFVQLGLQAHRAQLVDGEPCPLCGSTHHPGTGPIDTTVAALDAQKRELTGRLAELQARESTERARAQARAGRVLELAGEIARWRDERGTAAQRWSSLGGPDDPLDAASQGWLDARGLELNAQAVALAEQERAAAQLRQAVVQARAWQAEAVRRVDAARLALKAAEAVVASAAGKLGAVTTEVDAQRTLLDGTLVNLGPAFGDVEGWQAELQADPKAFTAAWDARVRRAREHAQACETSRKQRADLDTLREVQDRSLKEWTPQQDALDAERRQQAAELEALRASRGQVLQGRPAAEVEAELQQALKAAEHAHAAAADHARQTRDEAARRAEAHRIAAQAVAQAGQARQLAAQALAEALATTALDVTTLRARLAHDETWIARERAALNEVDRLRSSEAKAFEERRNDLSAHEAQAVPSQPWADIEAALAALEPLHGTQSQQLGAVKQQLEQDDANRATGETRARELEQARQQAWVWLQLDTLIGSADGRKFRKFAQSMTMELLLAHANAELASLAPRYLLQRVKTQDLELQVVDRDMGDEIRSTSSLSGGETFLVSLALALGLSSLASEKVRIASLFIDEGFGSLDPKTLEAALATLDALQSAGRKVGLISHVPGLAERIGVQVLVERRGQGASTVRVVTGAG